MLCYRCWHDLFIRFNSFPKYQTTVAGCLNCVDEWKYWRGQLTLSYLKKITSFSLIFDLNTLFMNKYEKYVALCWKIIYKSRIIYIYFLIIICFKSFKPVYIKLSNLIFLLTYVYVFIIILALIYILYLFINKEFKLKIKSKELIFLK